MYNSVESNYHGEQVVIDSLRQDNESFTGMTVWFTLSHALDTRHDIATRATSMTEIDVIMEDIIEYLEDSVEY